jgi:hypothetical protein
VLLVLIFNKLSTLFDTYQVPEGWSAPKYDIAAKSSSGMFDVNTPQSSQYFYTPYLFWLKVRPMFYLLAQLHNSPGNYSLAFAPSDPADKQKVQDFVDFVSDNWYPGGMELPGLDCPQLAINHHFYHYRRNCTTNYIPSLRDVTLPVFDDEKALEAYIKADDYKVASKRYIM